MLESILPAWAAPSCENRSALAVGYGALSRVTGLDGLLRGFGAPAGVHWALAGGAADLQCRGMIADKHLAMCMAGGYVGGMIGGMILG